MIYKYINNLFKYTNSYGEGEEINLLETREISKEAFKIAISLKGEKINSVKNIIQNFYSSGFYTEEELSNILEIFLLNYSKKNVPTFMFNLSKRTQHRTRIDDLNKYYNIIQDDQLYNFLCDEKIWEYSSQKHFKVIKIFTENIKKYPNHKEMKNTIKDLLRTPAIINKFNEQEISTLISLCNNKYAKAFLLEQNSDDKINILGLYQLKPIKIYLEYINKISNLDESIINFAMSFLKKYEYLLFYAGQSEEAKVEDIEEIISYFFLDNNVHFDLNSNDHIWHYLTLLQDSVISHNQTIEGKKAIIKLLTQNSQDNKIIDILMHKHVLTYLDGKQIVELYKEIEKNPLSDPNCQQEIYTALFGFIACKCDQYLMNSKTYEEVSNHMYNGILELTKVFEYNITVEEYLNNCRSIKEFLKELEKNDIQEFNLNTNLKLYKRKEENNQN